MAYQFLLQNGRLLLRLDQVEEQLREQGILVGDQAKSFRGLPPGTVLNDFALPTLTGETMTLSQWRGKSVLLIFFNPLCSFCRGMLPALGALPLTDGSPIPLIITTGDLEENRRLFAEHRLQFPVLLEEQGGIASLYRVNSTPVGYLVDENGRTVGELASGAEALLALARTSGGEVALPKESHLPKTERLQRTTPSVARSRIVRDGLKAGTRAPDFTLPGLDGTELSLQAYRGKPVLLVFSDPSCGPCRELAPKLEDLHRRRADLQMIMISRGDVESNRCEIKEFDLTFPVVIQRHWEVSRAYGMFATPIGYLVDEDGILVADVAVGAGAILSLGSLLENQEKARSEDRARQEDVHQRGLASM